MLDPAAPPEGARESPSTALDPGLRKEMSDAAARFAEAIGYASAGTAEFMLAGATSSSWS